jgi:epsin
VGNGSQLLNEIMPMIYKRFTEKTAEEWRQIYKVRPHLSALCWESNILIGCMCGQALQLLEFLIKNGAEQVIDDARSHLSTIKMLRQFYYIDQNGKDQGINVRNRAKELAELLSDVDKIRGERKKARQNKNKYAGVEGGSTFGGTGMSGGNGFGRKYGGFGSETPEFGGYPGRTVYGDGGGYGGSSGGFQDDGYGSRSDSQNTPKYDEYDEYDDGSAIAPPPRRQPPRRDSAATASKPSPKKAPELEIDLLGGDDETPATSNGKGKAVSGNFEALQSPGGDDDFDDFQSAAPAQPAAMSHPPLTSSASGISLVQPKPLSTNQKAGLDSLVGLTSPSPSNFGSPYMTPTATGTGMPAALIGTGMGMGAMKPTGYQPAQPNYFTSVSVSNTSGSTFSSAPSSSTTTTATAASSLGAQKKNDAFGSIWNQASSGLKKSTPTRDQTPSLQAMAKEKATAGIWGTGAATTGSEQKPGGGLEDLLG